MNLSSTCSSLAWNKIFFLQKIIHMDFGAHHFIFIENLGTTKYALTRLGYIQHSIKSILLG